MDEQRSIVDSAARRFETRGLQTRTTVLRARNAPKGIAGLARLSSYRAIVMADPEGSRWDRFVRGNPIGEVARKTRVRIEAVPVPSPVKGKTKRRGRSG